MGAQGSFPQVIGTSEDLGVVALLNSATRDAAMVKVKISRSGVVSYRAGRVRRVIAHGEYDAVQLRNGDWQLSKADSMYVIDAADIPTYLANRSLVRLDRPTDRRAGEKSHPSRSGAAPPIVVGAAARSPSGD